jgi:hypothetical protein
MLMVSLFKDIGFKYLGGFLLDFVAVSLLFSCIRGS